MWRDKAPGLRVDYYSLKKRVERESALKKRVEREGGADRDIPARKRPVGAASGRSKGSSDVLEVAAGTTFLELAAPARVGSCEWTLEFASAGGAKMRLEFKGVEPPDLAVLGRSFWQSESWSRSRHRCAGWCLDRQAAEDALRREHREDRGRRPRGRPVHEPDPHVRTLRGQSV
jgi:hypothetical protein